VKPSTSSTYNDATITAAATGTLGEDNGGPSQSNDFDQAFEKMAVSLWV
jgi:hypothetical protein